MRYLLLCLLCVFGSSAFAAKIQQPPINGFIVTYVSDKNIPIKVGERATTQAAFCNRLFTYSKSAHDREEKPAPHITYTYKVEEVQYGALGIYGTFSPGEGGCATFGTLTTLNTFNPPETVDETYYDHLHLSRGAVCSDLSDLVYDPDTKQNVCYVDPPKPPEPKECKAGEEILRYGFSAAGGEVNYNPNVCYEGCNYNYESRSGAGIEMPDYPGIFKYNVYYKSDGSECSAPTPPVTPPDIPDPPEEPCPEGWALGADGSTCFRKPDPDDGGTGGTGGTGGDDGGTGGTGGTGGDDGGTGGTGGTGDGGTGGDGDGEDEGEGKYSGGADCETAPECSGDAIQCGIVDQQWRMRCDFEKAYDYEAHKGDIEGLLQGDEFNLIEGAEAIEVPSFLDMHARWLGSSSCPPDETMTLRLGGGRTFALSYEPLCQAASSISPLLVIIATVLATLYIGRGSEG